MTTSMQKVESNYKTARNLKILLFNVVILSNINYPHNNSNTPQAWYLNLISTISNIVELSCFFFFNTYFQVWACVSNTDTEKKGSGQLML